MKKTSLQGEAKRLARLAAVQGLYRIELAKDTAEAVIRDFNANPRSFLDEPLSEDSAPATLVDQDLFKKILTGVTENQVAIDEMVAGALSAKLSAGRIEVLLRNILRSGSYELLHHGSIPASIIINDYVDVAHVFFSAKEPGLVNAVLDKLSSKVRGE